MSTINTTNSEQPCEDTGQSPMVVEQHQIKDSDSSPQQPDLTWWFLVSAIVVAVFGTGFYTLMSYLETRSLDQLAFRVVVNGETIGLSERDRRRLEGILREGFDDYHADTSARIESEIDRAVDVMFDAAIDRVPDYVDWHYSMTASVLKVAAHVSGDHQEILQDKVVDLVLGGEGWQARLESLDESMAGTILERQQETRRTLEEKVFSAFSDKVLLDEDNAHEELPELDLSVLLFEAFRAERADYRRWSISTSSGMLSGAGALALGQRLVSANPVMGQALMRYVPRAIARRAAATGATAAAGAAVTGPAAPLAGFGIGVTAFVGSEFVALELQKSREGPQLAMELEQSLETAREELKADLESHYTAILGQSVEQIQDQYRDYLAEADPAGSFHILAGFFSD